jgi:hypothetical protein
MGRQRDERGRRGAVILGALWLYPGSVLSIGVWAILAIFGTEGRAWGRSSGDSCTCVSELLGRLVLRLSRNTRDRVVLRGTPEFLSRLT